MNYTSIYNAITKNYLKESNESNEFQKYKEIWQKHPEVFKKGFEPYTFSQDNPGFIHVKRCDYDDLTERKHRIYINPSVKNREKFVHELIKQCIENDITFYFKYAVNDERTDNLLIYASDNQLQQYANILENIRRLKYGFR